MHPRCSENVSLARPRQVLNPSGGILLEARERYNLILSRHEPLGSADGILEPGEEFSLRGVTLTNNGGMATPAVQPIIVMVAQNEWIQPISDPVALTGAVSNGSSVSLDHLPPLRLRLAHAFPLVRNVIPVARPRLQFGAVVSRVNKRFAAVDAEYTTLEVGHRASESSMPRVHSGHVIFWRAQLLECLGLSSYSPPVPPAPGALPAPALPALRLARHHGP